MAKRRAKSKNKETYKTYKDVWEQANRISQNADNIGKKYGYSSKEYTEARRRANIAVGIATRYTENMNGVRGTSVQEASNKLYQQEQRDGTRKAIQERKKAEAQAKADGLSPRRQRTAGQKAYDKAIAKYVTPWSQKAKADVDQPIARSEYTNMSNGDLARMKTYGRSVSRYIGIPFADSAKRQMEADAYMARLGNKSAASGFTAEGKKQFGIPNDKSSSSSFANSVRTSTLSAAAKANGGKG